MVAHKWVAQRVQNQPGGVLWQAWHAGGFLPLPPSTHLQGIVFMYPLMPWIGLMAAGYALGPVFRWERARRTRFLLLASAALLLAFIVLRALNLYGDPLPWSPQHKGAMFDAMSFMRLQKYPPSLLYLCITGSIGLALLAAFERIKPVPLLMLFGGSPLAFYVIHIALIHALGNAYFDLRFGGGPIFSNAGPIMPAGYEPSLAVVYGAWLAMLGVMAVLVTLWRRESRRFLR